MIPQCFLEFDPPYPPHLGTPFLRGGVGWGGSMLLCVLWPQCVYFDLGLDELISCLWTP